MDEIVKRWTETTLAQSAFAQSAMDDGPMTAAEFEVRCFPREGGGEEGKGEGSRGGGSVSWLAVFTGCNCFCGIVAHAEQRDCSSAAPTLFRCFTHRA